MAENSAMRTETFPVGIVERRPASRSRGRSRRTSRRRCPPTPSSPSSANRMPRLNGRAKVTGAIRYTVDVAPQGLLFGRILRSPLRRTPRCAPIDYPRRRARSAGARDRSRRQPRRPGVFGGSLCRPAGRRGRGDLDGGGGGGASPHPRRLSSRCRSSSTWTKRAGRNRAKVYDAASAPGNSVGEIVAQAGLPLEGNVRGPGAGAPRRRRARLCERRRHRRRRIPHAGADALLHGAARPRRRLARPTD